MNWQTSQYRITYRKILQALIYTLVIFSSCNNNAVYERNHNISGATWSQDSSCVFIFDITDTLTSYDILIHIRNTGDYRFQNLLTYIDFHLPDNKIINDTVNCILSEKKGKWTGSGWGSIWSRTVMYKRRVKFPYQGQYSIVAEHAMRMEELNGITDIGIKIVKHDK